MASADDWRREYNFLAPEEIGTVFIADTSDGDNRSEPVRGYRREDLYFDFERNRPLTVRELSPQLSNAILDSYGFDPYSEDAFLDSETLLTEDGDEFLRIGYRDDAVYFGLNGSELPRRPDYLDAEKPRWRS